jgi:hypothetical protein
VVPSSEPVATHTVTRLDLKEDGTARLYVPTRQFSGAKQLATVGGLGDNLDGFHPVVAANGVDANVVAANAVAANVVGYLDIKLPRREAAEAAASMQQAVAAGRVTVRCGMWRFGCWW